MRPLEIRDDLAASLRAGRTPTPRSLAYAFSQILFRLLPSPFARVDCSSCSAFFLQGGCAPFPPDAAAFAIPPFSSIKMFVSAEGTGLLNPCEAGHPRTSTTNVSDGGLLTRKPAISDQLITQPARVAGLPGALQVFTRQPLSRSDVDESRLPALRQLPSPRPIAVNSSCRRFGSARLRCGALAIAMQLARCAAPLTDARIAPIPRSQPTSRSRRCVPPGTRDRARQACNARQRSLR